MEEINGRHSVKVSMFPIENHSIIVVGKDNLPRAEISMNYDERQGATK